MRAIKIHWHNGDYTVTSINGTTEEIKNYYLNQTFNLGDGAGGDKMVKCIDVEFLEEEYSDAQYKEDVLYGNANLIG